MAKECQQRAWGLETSRMDQAGCTYLYLGWVGGALSVLKKRSLKWLINVDHWHIKNSRQIDIFFHEFVDNLVFRAYRIARCCKTQKDRPLHASTIFWCFFCQMFTFLSDSVDLWWLRKSALIQLRLGSFKAALVQGYLSRSSGEKIEVVVEMVNTAKQEALCRAG